jgi:2-succinyl-5-enolpyruvyl-6-hydroxy-3-cyclohexene-1-carboxylate synthase
MKKYWAQECLLSNENTVWAAGIIETLYQMGIRRLVISPGSRSSPLVFAAALRDGIEVITILDERSASFYAVGLAKRSKIPVALICTSGSAVANYLPAVVEARMSCSPILLLTADRPPELRYCFSGQTIDQHGIYGKFVSESFELSIPEITTNALSYLRNVISNACRLTSRGPVHVNIPFREPLLPRIGDKNVVSGDMMDNIFGGILPVLKIETKTSYITFPESFLDARRGVIILGNNHLVNSYEEMMSVEYLANKLGWVVFADVLSSARNYASDTFPFISTYDKILRSESLWEDGLSVDSILLIGELPTSKVLRKWITKNNPHLGFICQEIENRDPMHVKSFPVLGDIQCIIDQVETVSEDESWIDFWVEEQNEAIRQLSYALEENDLLFEGKIPWVLSQCLPTDSNVVFASSMPVRDAEFFWFPNDKQCRIFCNRGANGIDGTLSTAMGVAHGGKPTFLITGDLAFLHDTNGLLNAEQLDGSLTVVLINNNGGGIFENLPVSQWENIFEEHFATPQAVDFEKLVGAYGSCSYHRIESLSELENRVRDIDFAGVRVLEIFTDRKADTLFRKKILG